MIKRKLCKWLWNLSEFTHIGLGRFAPYVFKVMTTAKNYKKVDKDE